MNGQSEMQHGKDAQRVRELFPRCPPGIESAIADHACRKYSARIGRSAAAKALDEEAVLLAVAAHVRHSHSDYDRLLDSGVERHEARGRVRAQVDAVMAQWRGATG